MGNFIFGLMFGIGGFYLIKEAFFINKQILFVGWAERKFGPGSGTTFYQFFGIALMIFGLFVAIGKIDLYNAAFGTGKAEQSQAPNPTKATQQAPNPNPKIYSGDQISQ